MGFSLFLFQQATKYAVISAILKGKFAFKEKKNILAESSTIAGNTEKFLDKFAQIPAVTSFVLPYIT